MGDRESSQCTTSHQQLFTDLHNLNQFCRIIIQVNHITGFLCSLCTTIHSHTYIRLRQSRSIICTITHHRNQLTSLLLFLDIFHLILRFSFSDEIIHTGFFCNIFSSQRVITCYHNRFYTHFTQTFKTLLNTRFDNILQFNNSYNILVYTYY